MKRLLISIGAVFAAAVINIQAQTSTTVQIPNLAGHVISYQGQNFLLSETTNANGTVSYSVSTFGVQGTNVMVVPASPDQAFAVASQWINNNNPANIGFYGTNEIEARLGAMYLQSSGEAAASISVEKWGTFGWQNIGFGAGVVQGNSSGKSGTAAGYAGIDYRKPIGDVAAVGGLVAGYDNWNSIWFVGPKVGLEYRQSAHLGEYIDAIYGFEPHQQSRGLIIAGGICYVF